MHAQWFSDLGGPSSHLEGLLKPRWLCATQSFSFSVSGVGLKNLLSFFILLYFLRFYLFIQTLREAEAQAEGEASSDVGLDPGTPGSRPEPKADAQPLSHLGVPTMPISVKNLTTQLRKW